jgi:hypothetical protein
LRSRALQTSFNPFTRPKYIHDHERFVCKKKRECAQQISLLTLEAVF